MPSNFFFFFITLCSVGISPDVTNLLFLRFTFHRSGPCVLYFWNYRFRLWARPPRRGISPSQGTWAIYLEARFREKQRVGFEPTAQYFLRSEATPISDTQISLPDRKVCRLFSTRNYIYRHPTSLRLTVLGRGVEI
jgi:hypothetical protein